MIDLAPDTTIRRAELHDKYGGRRYGGISPSKVTPNVFLFTDPVKGAGYGYIYDGWHEGDGLYHYTGEGQLGDQQMVQGNRAIRDHREEGRHLHLFKASNGQATYAGEFEYVEDYPADAPETGTTRTRTVIVFKLRQLSGDPPSGRAKVERFGSESRKEVPVEQHLTESMVIHPSREPQEAERREQKLVRSFMAYLEGKGREVCRLQLRPEDEPAPLFCDLYDKSTNTVYEAKGTTARPAFRMAIGQLADYARLIGTDDSEPRKSIIAPQKPRKDLLRLADSQGIRVVWPSAAGRGFETDDTANT